MRARSRSAPSPGASASRNTTGCSRSRPSSRIRRPSDTTGSSVRGGRRMILALILLALSQEGLVSTEWAYENLKNEKVRFVEVSVDPGVYEKGHLKGAVGFKWHSELCDPVSRDIVSPDRFQSICREAG